MLRPERASDFLADACAALGDAVNEVRVVRSGDAELVGVYAEMVRTWAMVVRRSHAVGAEGPVRLAVIDHLRGRLGQAQAGETSLRVVDVVDRLHGELAQHLRSA